jgi:hypothetical protein
MTTPRTVREGHVVAGADGRTLTIPAMADALDRETLVRVLDALRDLPQQPGRSPDPATDGDPALPLPRRRAGGSLTS